MKTYTKEELDKIIKDHNYWLKGNGKNCANLRSADLRFSDLRSVNLSSANLRSADLSFSDLRFSDLRSVNLSSANLRSTDLSFSDLRSTDLSSADLSFANLSSADLSSADLSFAKTDHRYISISGIGSGKRLTIFDLTDGKVFCGCFIGTLKEFEERVKETHRNNKIYLSEYLGVINYIKDLMKYEKET